jgi:phage replication O-like protein O
MDETSLTANPQIEDGFFPIANELSEQFARLQLSGNQWRLLWVILRQSYGWKKKADRISFTLFERRTGLDRRNIGRELKELASRNIIVKNDNSFIVSYGLQKDYSRWIYKPLSKMTTRRRKAKLYRKDKSKPLSKTLLSKLTTKPLSEMTTTKDTKYINEGKIFSQISELEKRYSNQEIIKQAFQVISSTRKSNRIAESVKLNILKSWERYPAETVMTGIRTYLSKGYHDQGKKEAYLLGIIRNNGNLQERENTTGKPVMKATGSKLDDYYREQGFKVI